jgi:hypothetical protein
MTKYQYEQRLEELTEGCPNHAMLPVLKKGYSTINAIYLSRIIKDLSDRIIVPEAKPQEIDRELSTDEARDEIFSIMLAKKYHLRSVLRAESNKFHKCKTNETRRLVSIQVNDFFIQLRYLQLEIDYYEKFGTMPPSVFDDENTYFEMPTTEGDVKKAINTAQVTISHINKDLLKYTSEVVDDKNHVFHGSYLKLTTRLNNWKKRLILLRQERETFKQNTNT